MKTKNTAARLFCSLCLISGFINPSGFAEEAVVPPRFENTPGPGAIGVLSFDFPYNYQAVVKPNAFSSLEIGQALEISALAFRLDSRNFGSQADIARIRISGSTTTKTQFSEFSANPAANHGPDYQVLFDGSLHLEAPTPNFFPTPFNLKIPLQSNLIYSPNSGSLVLQLEKFTSEGLGLLVDGDNTFATGFTLQGGLNGPYETFPNNSLLMQITYTVVPGAVGHRAIGIGDWGMDLVRKARNPTSCLQYWQSVALEIYSGSIPR